MSHGRASRRRFTLLAAPAAAVALAATLSACGTGGKSGGVGDTHLVTGSDGISTVDKGDRATAPKLDGQSVDGKHLDLADYKGKVVVLNAWGSWCGPCRLEAKHFTKVAKATADQGVQFLGINTGDARRGSAAGFEKDLGIEYPSFYDPTGKLLLRFPKGMLKVQTIPSTVVIDRDGKIAARSLMALDDTKLHRMIDPLITEK
ncbi:TlpA family protein disulfide reductase [Streptomyces sp. NPDC058221]|uniref:TlpA family protein disulfide reductase n=1 Tax=Streptomyces sp. NPDC058221 TaxID=3346388 RepID=UPI0036E7E443